MNLLFNVSIRLPLLLNSVSEINAELGLKYYKINAKRGCCGLIRVNPPMVTSITRSSARRNVIIYRHLLHGEGCAQLQSLPAGSRVYTRVAPRAPRYNRVAAINHGALADGERAQPVQVVTLPRIVGSFRQRAHAWPYVVRNWDREPCN